MKNIILLLLISFSVSLKAQKISPESIKYDFEIFQRALQETHPGIYRFTDKQSFDAAFESTARNLKDSLTREDFYKALAPLIAKVKCGHMKFFPAGGDANIHQFHYFFDTTRLFPFKLFFTEESVQLEDSYSGEIPRDLYGAKLLSINGKPMPEIKEKLFEVLPSDGNSVASKYLELNKYFPAWYANFFEKPDSITLEIEKTDSHNEKLHVKPVRLSVIRSKEKEFEKHMLAEPNFKLTFPENRVALMKIRAFYPMTKDDNFADFLKQSFNKINSNNTEHLILDLRDNEGGNDRWGALLYSYLTDKKFTYYRQLKLKGINYTTEPYIQKPKFFGLLKLFVKKRNGEYYWTKHKNLAVQKPNKNAYLKNVYVLLNGNSFSVTSEFAAIAKSNQRAIFFGQESGGTYEGNNSGTFAFVTLPHSRLTLAIPMLAYYLDVKSVNPMDRGILPDQYLAPSLGSYNSELEKVMDYIHTHELTGKDGR